MNKIKCERVRRTVKAVEMARKIHQKRHKRDARGGVREEKNVAGGGSRKKKGRKATDNQGGLITKRRRSRERDWRSRTSTIGTNGGGIAGTATPN